MWWMKGPAPAGFARNSYGLSRCIVPAARGSSSSTSSSFLAAAYFSTTSPDSKGATRYPPRPKPPPEHEFTEVYLKGTGPGGQKIVRLISVDLAHRIQENRGVQKRPLSTYSALTIFSLGNRTRPTQPSS